MAMMAVDMATHLGTVTKRSVTLSASAKPVFLLSRTLSLFCWASIDALQNQTRTHMQKRGEEGQ